MAGKTAVALIVAALSAICLFFFTAKQDRQETPGAAARHSRPRIKNIILMVGDGMGFHHVQAASLYLYGEPDGQPYNAFPLRVAMSTYAAEGRYDPEAFWTDFASAGQGATDSAAAATALATGSKTFRYAVGVDLRRRDLPNIVEVAEEGGRSTGLVTSVQFSHATPAAFVAHNPTRKDSEEIARDMVSESCLEVLMGCGHPWYDDNGRKKGQPAPFNVIGGESAWDALQQGALGKDCDGDGQGDPWALVQERQVFQELAEGETPGRVLGIAQVARTLQQRRGALAGEKVGMAAMPVSDRAFLDPFIETVPTLSEMTRAALNVLDNDADGFFLMVEGGAIDWASHANQSGRMIEEQLAFDDSVARVIEWVEKESSWDETLLIVTADHESGFLNGPGTPDQWHPLIGNGRLKQPAMQWHTVDHTNALVPLFAKGAGAERFREYLQPMPDPVHGPYLDNTAVGKIMMALFLPDAE